MSISIRDTRREQFFEFKGGLDLETPALSVDPGRMLSCKNYEVNTRGGYTSIQGYERYDGQPSPTDAEDAEAREVARAAIQAVPGSGSVRGVHMYRGEAYAFRDSVDGTECRMYKAGPTGWTQITTPVRLPGGRYTCVNYNFQGAAFSEVMVGVDAINKAFIYDGTTFAEITIPGEAGAPAFVAAHNNHLFLGMTNGMVYYSAVGTPTDFDPVQNAGGFGAGDYLTGLHVTVGGALAVMMRNRISVLYGSGHSDWVNRDLRNHDDQVGAIPYSIQPYNDLYFLTERGLTSLTATQSFGNFESATVSAGVNPLLMSRVRRVACSLIARAKNQYRLIFNPPADHLGSEILTLTFAANGLAGYSRQELNHRIVVATSGEQANGAEMLLYGADDGFVYRADRGASFDGAVISAYFRTAFAHFGSPRRKKQFLRSVFSIQGRSLASIRVKPLFNYNDPSTSGHRIEDIDILGGGAAWDEGNWNEFIWSAQVNSEGYAETLGIGTNMSLLVHSQSAEALPHTIYDAIVYYKQRGLK